MKKLVQKTMDGNTATAHVAYAFSEVAAIYPITPSSPMAETIDVWSAQGKKNLFGQPVKVVELQSEGGAAGTVHGSLQGGALTSTFTASQGLLLMIPNMYKMAGELLPAVFHVAARAVSTSAFSIFCDHQDVMSTRQTGFAFIASSSVQDAMNLAAVTHLSAIKSRIPFMHFFDGFRTSHEIQKIDVLDYEDLAALVDWDAVNEFRHRALNPDHPVIRGTVLNPDAYFQARESVSRFYAELPDVVADYMEKINQITGKDYRPFNYYGAPDAERIIIAMGSGCETIQETVNHLVSKGEKVGMVNVRLFRPFSVKYLLDVLPDTVKKIAVLDRNKEPGSVGEPLLQDVKSALYGYSNDLKIVGGRYGISSKEFYPRHVAAIFKNLSQDEPKDNFTVGIVDDLMFTSLPEYTEELNVIPKDTISCKFWGFGSDGTVSANKSAVKIIGDHSDKKVQAYFFYDTKKSGGLTVSHLRFGNEAIQSAYFVENADFIACHNQSYVTKYDLLAGLKDGGIFLLNCMWNDEELEGRLPSGMKRYIARHNIRFYTVNAIELASEIGLKGRINMIMQSAFFHLTDIIPQEDAVKYLKDSVVSSYGRQGEKIIAMNIAAIDSGKEHLHLVDVPASWADEPDCIYEPDETLPDFVKNMAIPMNRQEGDKLPVSAFVGHEDGSFPIGITAYEKRGATINAPMWRSDKCIQCNQCSFICPHAVIRPILLDEKQAGEAGDMPMIAATGDKSKKYHLAISPLDCTGCGNCISTCPVNALEMVPLDEACKSECAWWDYTSKLPEQKMDDKSKLTVKGSQFAKPLLEFSPACAGCVQTVYAKLITQLYGDRMMIANPAGCSGAWASATPNFSFTKNDAGHGPAWASSLFEDNAEYGYGMKLGSECVRNNLKEKMECVLAELETGELADAMKEWVDHFSEGAGTRERADRLEALLKDRKEEKMAELYDMKDFFVKRSYWLFGGDGWAYDIGFSGLDHVLASGSDINVIVFDTEVYSNTGGQASKSTPSAAITQFAAHGKRTRKKDLGLMAMSYGYIYVAQISVGADKNQALKAIAEAEAYPGPSLIIAYCPCLNHGIKGGMGNSIAQSKKAVEAGYWSLYRYDPTRRDSGQMPFIMDSKEPTASYRDFICSEVRYAALERQFPDQAEALYKQSEDEAMERLNTYKKLPRLFAE